MKRRRAPGFTLIELLVVIAIIGLLATLAVIQLSSSTSKARDAKRKSDLKALQKAVELYYNDNDAYPIAASWRGVCATYGGFPTTGANGYIPNLAPKYIGVLPVDPKQASQPAGSCYVYLSDGQQYKILARMVTESKVPPDDQFYDIPRSGMQFTYGLCSPPGGTACVTW
ncbi:MAG: prepilin-type N-terminal cleavage/methylation domain-containing protein [Patescibacteria group bacterium]